MRILLVNESARSHTGGVHRMVVESCDWLQRGGHEVALAFCDGGASEVKCRTWQFPETSDSEIVRLAFERILADFRPDVLQLHSTHNPWFLRPIADRVPTCRFLHDQSWFCSGGDRMAGDFTPCHRPHGWSCLFWHYAQRCGGKNPLGNWERWHKAESRSALKSAPLARVQVASEFMRRSLLENCYDADRIDVVPLFAVPSSVSVATEPGLLLVACRLVRSKGVHLLLQALGRSAALPWRLVIAGNGPELDRLRQTAGELGLSDRVNFLGELSSTDLAAWYARASIIISPTLRPEPFGLVGPEAMAHGKPVIAFAGGAHSEWLIDGETGVLVRERTAEALAKAIRDLLQSSERCAEMGARARKRWEQFHPEIYVGRVVASFERCRSDFASASSGGHA